MSKQITIEQIDAFIFDFDGVLTDNLVYISEEGREAVRCSRSDGLAFDVLRKILKPVYLFSTEENIVVSSRAKKLKVPVIQGISDKVEALTKLIEEESYEWERLVYIGNDLNDYKAMSLCGFSACPRDSHEKIQEIATFVLNTNGGRGVVRELTEDILGLDFINILYN